MQTTGTKFVAGDRIIFFAYADASMSEAEAIFKPGDYGVVSSVNEDGGLQVFLTDLDGKITSYEGDTLFPEEVQLLAYLDRLNVAELLS